MGDLNRFCDAMRWAAESDQVGYSQSDRRSLTAESFFKAGSYNTDCSALVIAALQHAGFDTGAATYTGNLSRELCARGWVRLPVDGRPQKGDVLLNDADHVAAWLGDCLAQASIDEHGRIAGGARGDQTGAEVNTRPYYSYPWNCYLRYAGTAGESDTEESEEDDMACIYQPNGEKRLMYYDGCAVHALTHPDQVAAVNEVYRQTHGRDIPMFRLGTKDAPLATRFQEAVS